MKTEAIPMRKEGPSCMMAGEVFSPSLAGGGEEIALVACGLLPLGVGLPMPPSRGRPILRGDDGAGGEDAFMGQGPQIGVLVRNGQLGGMIDADETAADADPHIQKGDHVPHG